MYSQRPSILPSTSPKPFDNRSLFHAVRLVSGSLVKRAGISSRDSAYAALLSDIWGQSHFATIDVLVKKRNQALGKRARQGLEHAASKSGRVHAPLNGYKSAPQPEHDDSDEVRRRKIQKRNAARDKLVSILRRVKEDSLSANERRLTCSLASNHGKLDVDAIRKLWGIPLAVFEVSTLDSYLRQNPDIDSVCRFYDSFISRSSPDTRIFNVLYWKENHEACCRPQVSRSSIGTFRSISRHSVEQVIRVLLTKRRSPFFEKNMDIVVETVMYSINPDRFIDRFRESFLREASFCQGLQGYEYSRSFTGALENLQLGKLNRLLKDIKAVKNSDDHQHYFPPESKLLSLRAVSKYCAERDTLTDRALRGVYDRYVRRRCKTGSIEEPPAVTMSEADFVRMYWALVGSGTDPGLKYWFSILDQDGDGWVGAGDIAHFYAERKMQSEKRNGICLADVQCLWIRLCAMTGVSPKSKGLDLGSLKDLSREDREFLMCALLVRRADNGNLINVAATVSAELREGFNSL